MDDTTDIIEAPLSYEALGAMYRRMCTDPLLANVPGKIELDRWGRMVMSPASNYHGTLQGRLAKRLAELGGEVIFYGKPHRPIYQRAMELAHGQRDGAAVQLKRVLAIGDSVRTDLAGAHGFAQFVDGA